MISNKLKKLFYLSVALIYLHALEEVLTGFPSSDSFMTLGGKVFGTTPGIFYWILHTVWLLGIPLTFILARKSILLLGLMMLFGVVFIFEFHHLIKALLRADYYPGMITAFLYPMVGIFYWKQLLADWRRVK